MGGAMTHYLDYNATAPLLGAARDAMVAALDEWGNPSSVHAKGRAARRLVEQARASVAAVLGAQPAEVAFTAGATEANTTALLGCGRPLRLASAIEHDSVLSVQGVETFAIRPDGTADLDDLARRLDGCGNCALVSLMAVNNETGVIQPVAEAAAIAHDHGALVHVDATQALGRIPVDRAAWGADLLTVSAHKIGGPKGAGALVVRDGLGLTPLLTGGGQERRRRAGTENVPAIAGFAAAVEALDWRRFGALTTLRDRLEAGIRAACGQARIWGQGAPRVANTSCIEMPGVPAETQVMAFDLAGIAVSAGSACSSGKVAASHVLSAMGADQAAGHSLRVSLPPDCPPAAIDAAIATWSDLWQRQAGSRAA
jgi:cysteine desulfurase